MNLTKIVGSCTSDKSAAHPNSLCHKYFAVQCRLKNPSLLVNYFSFRFIYKVPMKWKIIAAYLKALKKYSRMAYSFWHICFRSRYINVFVLCKLGKRWRSKLCNWYSKILNQEYLLKYWSGNLQTWHQKCTIHVKQNETCGTLAKATLFAPVSFCQNLNIRICNSFKWDRRSSLAQTWF